MNSAILMTLEWALVYDDVSSARSVNSSGLE